MLVRTTSYSLPTNLHTHIELVQPTTMFGRFKPEKSTIFGLDAATELFDTASKALPLVLSASGVTVDSSCNKTITVPCLLQLYNAVGYVPSNDPRNSIGITGYLVCLLTFKVFLHVQIATFHFSQEEFANIQDLQTFYAEQRPDAVNSSFTFHSVAGWCFHEFRVYVRN